MQSNSSRWKPEWSRQDAIWKERGLAVQMHSTNMTEIKKKGKNIYGEWDGSLNGLLLIPVFPKSELCIPAWSLEGKPRVGVYFRLQGCIFFFKFLLSNCLFCSAAFRQILQPSECLIFPRAVTNAEVRAPAVYSSMHSTMFCPGAGMIDLRFCSVDRKPTIAPWS